MRGASLAAGLLAIGLSLPAARAAEEDLTPPKESWSFSGPFGGLDYASAQRGYLIYQQVCSNCHSMKQLSYGNLLQLGLSAEQAKAIAASNKVPDLNDDGDPVERPATLADKFKRPWPNDRAARVANNGALPPDQSVIIKAREHGPDYIYALLQGYTEPPKDMKMAAGMNYNRWFPGHQIAMAQPLTADAVTYTDGTPTTLPQEAHDVVTFLEWAANPEEVERKRMGLRIAGFLVLMTGITYMVKRQIWSDLHDGEHDPNAKPVGKTTTVADVSKGRGPGG